MLTTSGFGRSFAWGRATGIAPEVPPSLFPVIPYSSSYLISTDVLSTFSPIPYSSSYIISTDDIDVITITPYSSSSLISTDTINTFPVVPYMEVLKNFLGVTPSTIGVTLNTDTALYTELNSTIGVTLNTDTALYTELNSTIGVTLSGAETESSTDPNFSSVSLLLHFDGSSGSTTFTDSSGTPKTVTANLNSTPSACELALEPTRDGSAILYLNSSSGSNSGGYASMASPSTLITANGDFTIECWFNSSLSTQGTLWAFGALSNISLQIGTNSTLVFYQGGAARITSGTGIFTTGVWNYCAVTRQSNNYRLFINGILINSYSTATAVTFTNPFLIGTQTGFGGSTWYQGYIDEFRITNGVARYTSSYKPVRLQPYPNS